MTDEQKELIQRYRRRYELDIQQLYFDMLDELAMRLGLTEDEVAKEF